MKTKTHKLLSTVAKAVTSFGADTKLAYEPVAIADVKGTTMLVQPDKAALQTLVMLRSNINVMFTRVMTDPLSGFKLLAVPVNKGVKIDKGYEAGESVLIDMAQKVATLVKTDYVDGELKIEEIESISIEPSSFFQVWTAAWQIGNHIDQRTAQFGERQLTFVASTTVAGAILQIGQQHTAEELVSFIERSPWQFDRNSVVASLEITAEPTEKQRKTG